MGVGQLELPFPSFQMSLSPVVTSLSCDLLPDAGSWFWFGGAGFRGTGMTFACFKNLSCHFSILKTTEVVYKCHQKHAQEYTLLPKIKTNKPKEYM